MSPNILYVFTDRQHHAAMNCAGKPEQPNLALQKRFFEVVAEHRRALLKHRLQTRDNFGAHRGKPRSIGILGIRITEVN